MSYTSHRTSRRKRSARAIAPGAALGLALLLALPLTACGPIDQPLDPRPSWTVTHRIALPSTPDLVPDDPARPGDARPQAVAVRDGLAYVTLTHLLRDPGFGTAGPGYLSVHDSNTLERLQLIPLVFDDDGERVECRNPGDLLLTGAVILVTCSGDFDGSGALAELTIDGPRVNRIVRTGGAPGALIRTGENTDIGSVWLSDLTTGSLLRVSLPSYEVLNGAGGNAPIELCPVDDGWEFVSALKLADGRGFASCFNGGHVVEFNPLNGALIGERLEVGDGPRSFAVSGRHLFVLDNLGATLSRVSLTHPPKAHRALLPLGQLPEGIAAHDGQLAVTNAGDGTVTFIDPLHLTKTASVDLKSTAGDGTPYPWGVTFDEGGAVFVTLNTSNELVRIERAVGEDE